MNNLNSARSPVFFFTINSQFIGREKIGMKFALFYRIYKSCIIIKLSFLINNFNMVVQILIIVKLYRYTNIILKSTEL